jgi:cobalt-zinc-cadmium resistance protein CzcA
MEVSCRVMFQIVPIIDRTELNTTVNTVSKNLVEGVILVSIIVFIFLYNWRTTFIVASVIPLAFFLQLLC